MQKLILAFALLFSASAFACEVQSAQFTGVVKNYTATATGEAAYQCTYQIEFSRFATSNECPLELSDAAKAEFPDYSCEMHNGQAISGTVSKKAGFFFVNLN